MNKLIMALLVLLTTVFATEKVAANSSHHESHARSTVILKGGGTYAYPNNLSNGFNFNVVELKVKARGHHLIKGIVSIIGVKPVDPITGTDEQAKGFIDAVRVFATHPDVVWVHGFLKGFILYGTEVVPPNGSIQHFNSENGEFIGAVTSFGRTNFLSRLENNNQPLPDFFTATEDELIEVVEGFSRILLTNGAKPAKMFINTPDKDIIIRK